MSIYLTYSMHFCNIFISMKKNKKDFILERYSPSFNQGLNAEQIAERSLHGLVNDTKVKSSKTYASIFIKNTCTFFNLIWILIAAALISVGSYKDLLFLVVIVLNTSIAIIQECRAKHTVQKLSLVVTPNVKVIRNGSQTEIRANKLVLDDVVLISNGDQVPSDCIIMDGEVEVNESLLTGESRPVKKQVGDVLLSGSFLVSGTCFAKIERIGKDNYIQSIAAKAKEFKAPQSNLFKSITKLIRYIGIALIPLATLTIVKEYFWLPNTIKEAVTNTAGAITGMVPAGMFLLITISLSVGVIKLAKKKTLVKDIYSIEMLSRSDVLCLDKTGTITDGTMNVKEVICTSQKRQSTVEKIIANILGAQRSNNATSLALIKKFGTKTNMPVSKVLEFSSQRKFSATTFKNGKTYYLGAPSFVKASLSPEHQNKMNEALEKGYRVIALTETNSEFDETKGATVGETLALFVIEDHIRENAVETIRWFKENGVDVKIISGDDPLTVSKIAERVGVENSDKFVSLENMSLDEVEKIANDFTVFGRVSPEQKFIIVKSLRKCGKVVAMTGDGVNDTLALKEADCSIAMADGSEVARNISNLVLLDSNFTSLPCIVKEGRQVVNNVQNSSVLFLMKTLFTLIMCTLTILMVEPYPCAPRQLFLLEMFVIGLPSFILTFQPNTEIIKGNFIPQVLKKALPLAVTLFLSVWSVIVMNSEYINILSSTEYDTLITLVFTFVGYLNLIWLCMPPTKLRIFTLILSLACLVTTTLVMPGFFTMTNFSSTVLTCFFSIVGVVSTILIVCALVFHKIPNKLINKHKEAREAKILNDNNRDIDQK